MFRIFTIVKGNILLLWLILRKLLYNNKEVFVMNETTKKILESDPIAMAEAFLGKPHEKWDPHTDGMFALQFAMATNDRKRKHLEELGDTHFGITWEDFIQIAKGLGFENALTLPFIGTSSYEDAKRDEEEIIFFHKEKGLILHAVSFTLCEERSVNSAKVYGEIKIGEKLSDAQWNALHGCSHGGTGHGTMTFDVDVREGFCHHINAISEVFEFLPNWTEVPFLWFLNYTEEHNLPECFGDKTYEKITHDKIKACKPEVSKIIYNR